MYNLRKWSWLFLCFMAGSTWIVQGDQVYQETPLVESKMIDSFSMGVSDQDGHTNSAPDRYLCFAIWCTNGPVRVAYPATPEYAYQVELFDSNGLPIPKTALGKKTGSKFWGFDENALKSIKIGRLMPPRRSEPVPWLYMFRPADLFEIQEPGNYTLRIRFQIVAFPRTGPNRGDYKKELIRFPALDYPLVQSQPMPKSP